MLIKFPEPRSRDQTFLFMLVICAEIAISVQMAASSICLVARLVAEV